MADRHLTNWPVADQIEVEAAPETLVEIGDLMFLDTDEDPPVAKPASSQDDALTEAANQSLFATRFLGISNSKRLASDLVAGPVRIITNRIFELPCVNDDYEVGDFIGAVEADGGEALENQLVTLVDDQEAAIGIVMQRASGTMVKALVFSRYLSSLPPKKPGAALTAQLTEITHVAPGTPDYAVQDFVDVEGDGSKGFSFKTKDEANTVLSVIKNLQVRMGQVEDRLEKAGIVLKN